MTSTLEQQIRAAYATEEREKPVATSADQIPISYESITPEWVTSILCNDHPGAKVVRVQLGPRDSGTSNRRRIELFYNDAVRAAGLPGSIFCKASHELRNRLISGHSGGIHCEVTFYRIVRNLLQIEAPVCYWAIYDPVSFNSIVVLQDMTGEVEYCNHKTPVDRARAESQLALLAAFHGRFYESPQLTGALSALPTWNQRFDNLASFKLEECCAYGFEASRDVIPERLFAQHARIWPATLASVERHRQLPHTLCHGDVHLKNWYITPRGMGLGDWQVTHRGHWSRDFAYTISTSLAVEDRRAWERDLLQFYLRKMQAAGGPELNFDDAWRNYRQQLASVLAFWTLTLTPSAEMPDMQPKDTTVEFIRRIAHAMDDLQALDSFA
jgi:hypothetical protein